MMRHRHREGHLGLLLLASQMFQMGVSTIPPVTLSSLALNVYLYLWPVASPMETCISVQWAYWDHDWRRLLLSPLHHADDWHLYLNMVSLLWKGSRLERRLGGMLFAYMLIVFSLLTGVVYMLLASALAYVTRDQSYNMQCAIGFSGVLFALKVVSNHCFPGGVTHMLGIPISNRFACWIELVLIHILSPGTSFLGHLAGILVGFLYVTGPLRCIMNWSAGASAENEYSRRRAYYSSSGYSGLTAPPPAQSQYYPYTGGLSEEEQLDEALRASLIDRSNMAHGRPPYGFNIPPGPMSAEELRRHRIRRFDR